MGIEPTGHMISMQPDGFEDRGQHQLNKHFQFINAFAVVCKEAILTIAALSLAASQIFGYSLLRYFNAHSRYKLTLGLFWLWADVPPTDDC